MRRFQKESPHLQSQDEIQVTLGQLRSWMPRHVINLCDNQWQFGQIPRQSFTAPDVYDLPAVTEWLPATVPGNVRTDLLALNRIPDPFFAEGYKESLWVEAVDWWYKRVIKIDSFTPAKRAFVIFNGIDYLSAIFVNGQEITRHEGMFSTQIVEIPEAAQNDSFVEIAVRLWGSSALPRRQLNRMQQVWQKIAGALHGSWVGIYPDRSASLKCQMSFGWDFAPPIRTIGMWDDVQLVVTGQVFIEAVNATGQPEASPPNPPNRGALIKPPSCEGEGLSGVPANFTINLTLDSQTYDPVEAIVRITPANFDGPSVDPVRFFLDLSAGHNHHQLQLNLPQAALWQPWDRGQPYLYNLTIIVIDQQGNILDQVETRTGVRAVKLEGWQFRINGQPEFMRGLNWVPADCFPGRLRTTDYTRLLMMARDSGANLLRVWGGGLREKRAFYDLCDELGMLVWQEFPFACMFLGSYPRHAAYLAQVKAECRAVLRQLSHHPSIAVWCGGNEFSRRRNRPLIDTLAAVVDNNDGTRPFIPVSPSFDHGGDAHNWQVWHGGASIQAYQSETAHFLSEFGLQALPHIDTLSAVFTDPHSTQAWSTHHADVPKLIRYTKLFKNQLALNNKQFFNHNKPIPAASKSSEQTLTIYRSQLAQATALQTGIEHMRRHKEKAGGVCLWQFNEPWPAISWAIVDYFGRPKLAYQRLATWYNPILVCLNFPVGQQWQIGDMFTAEIWAINDTLEPLTGCQLQIDLDKSVIHTQPLSFPADSAQCTGLINHRLTAMPRRLSLVLSTSSNILCQNHYDLDWSDPSHGSLSQRFRRWVANLVMR